MKKDGSWATRSQPATRKGNEPMTNTIMHWVGGESYEGTPAKRIPVENPATGKVESESG